MKILCLQHVPFEGPAYIQTWAKEHGHDMILTPVYLEELIPDFISIDALLVMGGPMSIGDYERFPWLREEKEFILNAINAGLPTIGICLGAQLIADVLGADVKRNAQKEIGWYPVTLSSDAMASPFFKDFPENFEAFHWHGDTFDLPEGAVPVGYSNATKNQGFYLDGHGKKVMALQFHLESTEASIRALCENSVQELAEGGKYVSTSDEMLSNPTRILKSQSRMRQLLDNVFQYRK